MIMTAGRVSYFLAWDGLSDLNSISLLINLCACSLVIVSETGKHNWREVIDQGGDPEQNLIRYWHQFLSRIERWAAGKGDREDGIVLILDFEGFQLSHFNSRQCKFSFLFVWEQFF